MAAMFTGLVEELALVVQAAWQDSRRRGQTLHLVVKAPLVVARTPKSATASPSTAAA